MTTEYEVFTENEDGWTDYHTEEDITDDYEIAIIWLNRDDCLSGEIRVNGEIVVSKDRDGTFEFAEGYSKYQCPNEN